MRNCQISLYLDTRRSKKNGKFPLKLRVYSKQPRKQKFYPLEFEFTQKEFNEIWNTVKPRNGFKETRDKIQSILLHAKKQAESLPVFDFDKFERMLFSESNPTMICHYFDEKISQLKRQERFSTLKNYESTRKHIVDFSGEKTLLSNINTRYLEDLERHMSKSLKPNTIAGYMRQTRSIINAAIADNNLPRDLYPFGPGKYQIRMAGTIKKALSKSDLKTLFEYIPNDEKQQFAKDIFFFSFFCSGINLKDIITLKNWNLQPNPENPERVVFSRSKTGKTTKAPSMTTIYLNHPARAFVDLYRVKSDDPENYVFGICDKSDSQEVVYRKVTTTTQRINQALEQICKNLNWPKITLITARHSFATTAINNGVSMTYVSKSMGHTNLKTTEIYFAGFSDETAKQLSELSTKF